MGTRDNGGLVSSFVKLAKPRVSMLFAFTGAAALGAIIAGKGFPSVKPTLMAIISTFFITLATYLYNDVIDAGMDAESKSPNKEGRPLASGEVSKRDAYLIIIPSSILGVGLAWFINPVAFYIALSFWVLFMLYSFPLVRFKRFFVVKSLITSAGPTLALLVGMSAVLGRLYPFGLFTAFVQWVFLFLVLPSLADSADIEEDARYGMKTIAMVLRWEERAKMLMFAPIFVAAMNIVAYFLFNLNALLPVLSVVSTLLYAREINKIINRYDSTLVWKVRKLGFVYYDLTLIYVVLGSLNLVSIIPF